MLAPVPTTLSSPSRLKRAAHSISEAHLLRLTDDRLPTSPSCVVRCDGTNLRLEAPVWAESGMLTQSGVVIRFAKNWCVS